MLLILSVKWVVDYLVNEMKVNAGNCNHKSVSNTDEKIMGGVQMHKQNTLLYFPAERVK